MSSSHADENLLFGVLALQLNYIDRSELIAATSEWIIDKSQPLSAVLLRRESITADEHNLLKQLVQQHLKRHQQNVQQSLASLPTFSQVKEELERLNDPDVTSSLGYAKTPGDIHSELTSSLGHSKTPAGKDPDETIQAAAATTSTRRFKVVRPHAKGGLGKVSVAIDRELNREVALKEIHSQYADHPDSRARFQLEAEITGGLEHPGVVPVYSLGASEDGRPFYAMRFIRGESLREAIKKHHAAAKRGVSPQDQRLELRQLIGRFVGVCHVMQYAHDRGVVHRDLKPDNIMLGDYGETLVVDWGLAKSLDDATPTPLAKGLSRLRPSSASHGTPTVQGSALGTPAYMSPEQAAGRHDVLGPPSDIYSLGATLYCLLVDRPPVDAKTVELALTKVRKGEFPPPRQVNTLVPSPLNAICMKAMALEPNDRYPTCRALAEDLERWLADEPVSVYREPMVERAARWMRRHRSWTISGAVALLVVALVSAGAALAVNAARQEELRQKNIAQQAALAEAAAKRDALRRFHQARQAVDTWLTSAAVSMEYAPGMQEARRKLLLQAAADYEQFAQVASQDPEVELERAKAHVRLGDIRRQLGEYESAERAYRLAEQLLDGLLTRSPEDAATALERANCRTKRGLLLVGMQQVEQGQRVLQSAIDESQSLTQRNPQDAAAWQALGAGWFNLGYAHFLLGEIAKAKSGFDESTRAFEQVPQLPGREAQRQADLSQSLAWLGRTFFDERDNAAALRRFEDAMRWFNALVAQEPANPDYLNRRAETLVLLSGVQRSMGDVRGEIDTLQKALDDYGRLVAAPRDVLQFQQNHVVTRIDYGQLLHEIGRTGEALTQFDTALEDIVKFESQSSENAFWRELEATCRDMRGESLRELGRFAEAEAEHRAAVKIFDQFSAEAPERPEYRHRRAICESHVAQAMVHDGRIAAAEPLFRSALKTLEEMIALSPDAPQYHDDVAYIQEHLANAFWQMQDPHKAGEALKTALDTRRKLADQWPVPEFQQRYAWLLATCFDETQRDPAAAQKAAEAALETSPDNAEAWCALGAARYRAGETKEALAALERAVARRVHPSCKDYFLLALTYAKQGDADKAAASLEKANTMLKESRPASLVLQRLRAESEAAVAAPKQATSS
jgi:serine/threonine-protein kinase